MRAECLALAGHNNQAQRPTQPAWFVCMGARGTEMKTRKHPESGHNLCLSAGGGLSNPLYLHQRPFGALVQSNKVYLPRMYIAHDSGLAARQINAIR